MPGSGYKNWSGDIPDGCGIAKQPTASNPKPVPPAPRTKREEGGETGDAAADALGRLERGNKEGKYRRPKISGD
jgi:hypothetical protein